MYYIHNLIFFQFVLVKFIIVRLWNMHDISHIKLFFYQFFLLKNLIYIRIICKKREASLIRKGNDLYILPLIGQLIINTIN